MSSQLQNLSRLETQLVVFKLGNEEYALGISGVREIIRSEKVTRIPESSERVEGIINVRGEVVVVIDLRKWFEIPVDSEEGTAIIIVEHQGSLVGLIVDSLSEVLRVTESDVVAPPKMLSEFVRELVTGVVKLENRLLILLNLRQLLACKELEETSSLVATDASLDQLE